jgi:hypothetical protein
MCCTLSGCLIQQRLSAVWLHRTDVRLQVELERWSSECGKRLPDCTRVRTCWEASSCSWGKPWLSFFMPESKIAAAANMTISVSRAIFTHRPKGPGPRVENFRGRHIKKNQDWSMVCGEKKGCPQQRNLREIYTENTIMFCLLSVFVLFLLTHNWIRTNFLGPRGVKYLNTGLSVSIGFNPKLDSWNANKLQLQFQLQLQWPYFILMQIRIWEQCVCFILLLNIVYFVRENSVFRLRLLWKLYRHSLQLYSSSRQNSASTNCATACPRT